MPRARISLISLDDTPYYHCVSRCVPRAFLWGTDHFSGKDYSHRKQWVVDRLQLLTQVFAIEVCAYAVMSNHYHVVLHVDKQRALSWTDAEVVERWTQLFGLAVLIQRYLRHEAISQAEQEMALAIINTWRERLYDISWFMRCLNEYLAREANKEDSCTGRFWEGRFKSQALLDEAGLLTCMAYVDLNPVRAGIAKTPEDSEFTSIQKRIRALKKPKSTPKLLKPFNQVHRDDAHQTIPFVLHDYLELVEWTGRVVCEDKRGAINKTLPPILSRLIIDTDICQQMMQPKGNLFKTAIGRIDTLRSYAERQKQAWCQGHRHSTALFPT